MKITLNVDRRELSLLLTQHTFREKFIDFLFDARDFHGEIKNRMFSLNNGDESGNKKIAMIKELRNMSEGDRELKEYIEGEVGNGDPTVDRITLCAAKKYIEKHWF